MISHPLLELQPNPPLDALGGRVAPRKPAEGRFGPILRLAARALKAKVSLITTVQTASDRRFFVDQVGLPAPCDGRRDLPLSQWLCRYVRDAEMPLAVRNCSEWPGQRKAPVDPHQDATAFLGVPVRGPNKAVVAVLFGLDLQEREWTGDDVATLDDLASRISDEIRLTSELVTCRRQHRDLMQSHDRVRRHAALQDNIVAAFTAPNLTVDQRFGALLQAGCTALSLDAAAISRIDGDRGRVLAQFHRDAGAQVDDWDISGSLSARALSGQEILRSVARPKTVRALTPGLRGFDGSVPECYFVVPLVMNDCVFGTLELIGRGGGDAWIEEESAAVSLIAMFVVTQLELSGQIERLRRSESALLQYVLDLRAGTKSLTEM